MNNIAFNSNWENYKELCTFKELFIGQFFVDCDGFLYLKADEDFAIEIQSGAQIEFSPYGNQSVWYVPAKVTIG